MEQWIEIASKNGLAIAVLVALAMFIYKKLWPRFEKRLDDADVERKENLVRLEEQGKRFTDALKLEREDNARRFDDQSKVFTESLRTLNVLAAETHREAMKAQNEIVKEMRTLNQRLKNGNGR